MNDPNDLASALPTDIAASVSRALAEDIGSGDLTAILIPAGRHATATVTCREPAVLAGAAWFDCVFNLIEPAVITRWHYRDGATLPADVVVCELAGPARAIVSGERTALNYLQTLSATATVTRRYVEALGKTRTRILDTRKTLPGLRTAQKYAVRAGGGLNHRMGLFDAVLIKENHIAAAGSITAAVTTMRNLHPEIRIEVEVENLDELNEALTVGVDMILLDNFDAGAIRAATAIVGDRALVEISGGVDLNDLAVLGQLGADYISVGALTKHVRAIDFSMRIWPN